MKYRNNSLKSWVGFLVWCFFVHFNLLSEHSPVNELLIYHSFNMAGKAGD